MFVFDGLNVVLVLLLNYYQIFLLLVFVIPLQELLRVVQRYLLARVDMQHHLIAQHAQIQATVLRNRMTHAVYDTAMIRTVFKQVR